MKRIFKIFGVLFALVLLGGCFGKESKKVIPDLTGKTKTEIQTIFDGFKKDLTLDFEYEYANDVDQDVFVRYQGTVQVGDEIKKGDSFTIVLAAEKLHLPDLTGKNEEEIKTLFNNINSSLGSEGVTLKFKYSYPIDEEDKFIGYLNGSKAGDVVRKGSTINISMYGNYVKYPIIATLTTEEMQQYIGSLFNQYENLNYKITFLNYYAPDLEEGEFHSYVGGEPEEEIRDLDIKINIASHTFYLPDLNGLQVEEIKDLFEQFSISLNKLNFVPDYSQYVKAGEFISYQGYEIGDEFDLNTTEKITIVYDIRPILKDLEYYNKYQIEKEFESLSANISFEYILDNDKEYDTFAGYKNYEIGDEIVEGMNVIVSLYKNDDANAYEEVNVEEQLMISKYIGGFSWNMGIELWNPTDEDIDLADYYIAIIPGGQITVDKVIQLDGILHSNAVYTIVNTNADTELRNKSNMQTTQMDFGANSTIQLRRTRNRTYIDTIYNIANTSTSLDREIFVRKGHITHGRRDFVYTEWKGYVPTYFDVVGTHPNDGPEDPEFVLIADKTFQEYGMTKVRYLSAADGDTVYFESLDSRDPTSYNGNSRVRFLIIDTPETEKPGVDGEPYANAATDFTRNMLSNALEIYIQACEEAGIIDTYGRHLALIWANVGTAENPNWKLLNYELLKAGLGQIQIAKIGNYQNYPIFSNRYLYSWAHGADNYAKENKLGLYSGVYQS